MERGNGNETFKFGVGIIQLFGHQVAGLVSLLSCYGVENLPSLSQIKKFTEMKNYEIKEGFESLFSCGILEEQDGKVVLNQKRIEELNIFGVKILEEKYKVYKLDGSLQSQIREKELESFVKSYMKSLDK